MTKHDSLDLSAIAEQTMVREGFEPKFPAGAKKQLQTIREQRQPAKADSPRRDLRNLLWSSIDDGKTRDLDQLEYAERLSDSESRLLLAIADVDAFVQKDSPIDQYASHNCTSVYTGVRIFPMLPEELSTDLTSLVRGQDRLAVITELTVAAGGAMNNVDIYPATVRSSAKLSYDEVGDWLDGKAGIPKDVKDTEGLEAQVRLQAEIAESLADFRKQQGSIDLTTIQAVPVTDEHGKVTRLKVIEPNSARELIANFMIAANIAMAQFLEEKGGPSLRRVVREPERWDRIVDIAESHGEKLPPEPDSIALAAFLNERKKADPVHYPDLSLAVVKALGPGEYILQKSGEEGEGHFGLAASDYTHSTAPNRRFADLVVQRLVKAALRDETPPYSEPDLKRIAERCTEREDASRKVERKIRKVAAAVLLKDRVGQVFDAIVTGVTEKGTFARALKPPVDGRIMRGEEKLRVGDRVKVRLLDTDPTRGFIDFGAL